MDLSPAGQFLLPGIRVLLEGQTLVIQSGEPLFLLSSAVLGGGFLRSRHIINHHVSKEYDGQEPWTDLQRVARELGLEDPVVGLMTAVDVSQAVLKREAEPRAETHAGVGTDDFPLEVIALATAGVGNPGCAGSRSPDLTTPAGAGITPDEDVRRLEPAQPTKAGTINIILLVAGNLTRGAMVNAVMTATEAKARALFDLKVRCPDGQLATGTTSDAIVIACTGRGAPHHYAGTATHLGAMIGRTVYASVRQGVVGYRQRVMARGLGDR